VISKVKIPIFLKLILTDFLGLMMTVQGLPTNGWGESEISEILAKAFMLRSTYTLKQLS